MELDVPSPIDLRDPEEARAWERSAPARPGRTEMFERFRAELRRIAKPDLTILELGSGPGYLAEFLLEAQPELQLTLLDYSPAMHELARVRLGRSARSAHFLELNFKAPDWAQPLGAFDAVVTNQAVHELRHKRHAEKLHSDVAGVMSPGGVYLVCDHFFGDGGMQNEHLFMTIAEQAEALRSAGFESVDRLGQSGTLVMHRAIHPY